MGHVIIEENLYDKAFVASRTEGYLEEYSKIVEGYTPESVEEITGVSAQEIRQAARMYASEKRSDLVGYGRHPVLSGCGNRAFTDQPAMPTGNLGSQVSAGVNPVRGQNNVQGACDMGALPDTYPGYQYVKLPGKPREVR